MTIEIKKDSPVEAPAVHTNSKVFVDRIATAKKELESLGGERSMSALQKRATLNAKISELQELENRRVHGAPIRLPRGLVLDLGDLPSQYPDRHFRWVNVDAPGKAASAIALGYTRVPPSEGGKQIGDLALFYTSQDRRAERVGEQNAANQKAIESYKNEIRTLAEKVVEEIYNKTGKDISKGSGTLLVEDR